MVGGATTKRVGDARRRLRLARRRHRRRERDDIARRKHDNARFFSSVFLRICQRARNTRANADVFATAQILRFSSAQIEKKQTIVRAAKKRHSRFLAAFLPRLERLQARAFCRLTFAATTRGESEFFASHSRQICSGSVMKKLFFACAPRALFFVALGGCTHSRGRSARAWQWRLAASERAVDGLVSPLLGARRPFALLLAQKLARRVAALSCSRRQAAFFFHARDRRRLSHAQVRRLLERCQLALALLANSRRGKIFLFHVLRRLSVAKP